MPTPPNKHYTKKLLVNLNLTIILLKMLLICQIHQETPLSLQLRLAATLTCQDMRIWHQFSAYARTMKSENITVSEDKKAKASPETAQNRTCFGFVPTKKMVLHSTYHALVAVQKFSYQH